MIDISDPCCIFFSNRYKDERAYVSSMRKKFPKIVKLDGHVLPPPIKFEVESTTSLPEVKGSVFGNEQVKNLVVTFLKQYVEIFDSDAKEGRQKLMDAYHEEAVFSLSVFYNDLVSGKGFGPLMQESRNLKKVRDSFRRNKGLKSGKLNIVACLGQLPKTQHDTTSLTIDVNHTSDSMLSFTMTGVFKEKDSTPDGGPLRAFSRTFVAVPHGQGIVIVNDILILTNPSQDQVKDSFKNPAPTPSSSPVPSTSVVNPGLTEELQQQMVVQFANQSTMNEEWSARCLIENLWDYDKAAKVFLEAKEKGAIPAAAFVK